MARSYTELRNTYAALTNNSSSDNLTLGDRLTNDAQRRICAMADWPWLQASYTASTATQTQFYNLPYDYDRAIDVTVTIGTSKYTPQPCPSREDWDRLNATTSVYSDTPEWYFIFNGQIGFWPIPSSTTSNAITLNYRKRVIDLSLADYTTGTVAVTSGATTVTGSGTSWTAPMAGRWIKITPSNTAGASGDGMWYQVSSVASTTSLTLTRPYGGTTVSGSGAYVLGEMSLLPEAYQDIPLYWAASVYFLSVQPEKNQHQIYKQLYDEGVAKLQRDYTMKSSNPVIRYGLEPSTAQNPNLSPSSIG